MTIDWHWIAEALLGSGVVGFGWRSAKARGAQEKTLKDMADLIIDHGKTLAAHTAQLADGEGNFKVIVQNFEFVKDGLKDVKEAQKETNKLIIEHITKGQT